MQEPNLLDIVPDKLFQTHSIGEIDNVQKKLQYEIERKREELRAMVGERYRDLIYAADTIEEMLTTTSSTLEHINDMIATCKNLHDTHLVGFKINEKKHLQNSQTSMDPVHSISVQIKLLMEIPEKIWKSLEVNDFVKAAQLFIMARHINTGLQLQIADRNTNPGKSLYQLVQQQWNSISHLSNTIVEMCGQKLQDVDISTEVSCSCLVGLYLLDSQSMVELLNTLIDLHSNTSLKLTLQFDLAQILEDVKAQIKKKIINSVKIVMKTVVLVYACFVENQGGAVLEKLKELYRPDSQPLIELIQFSDASALKLLPSAITNYRLSLSKDLSPLAADQVTGSVQRWSVWVQTFIHENVTSLLQNITRIRVLHEIREETFKIESPQNWSTICSSLGIPEVHIWCTYFQPLLTARVRNIIDTRWQKINDSFKTQILIDLSKVASDDREADINWFVWKDLIGDTVIESRNEVVSVMEGLMKGMSRQDRGFTPALQKLCQSLDDELQKLLEDLKDYLYERKDRDTYLYDDELDQVYTDKEEIEMYLKEASDRNIHSIIQYIRACFDEPTLQSTELQRKTTAVYTARFTQAITVLMPCLRKCYITLDDTKAWNDICTVLKENCLFCWNKWLDIAEVKINELTNGLPQKFTLEDNIDYLMMEWDVIKIEEKDEDGNPLESTIKVPAGPSMKLQEYLYSISRILDEVVPHTLPSEIHSRYIDKTISISLAHYNKVIRENEQDINQRCALQLLMDVRHLTLLMVARDNKAMEVSQDICEFLRHKIDPFDYDVFYPYIQTSLKRSVQRVMILLGSTSQPQSLSKPIRSGGTADSAARVLAAADAPWFSLLPVAVPVKKEKVAKKKPSASPSKTKPDVTDNIMSASLPINFANARSGAASFFNSMTSDWFSG
ncbi:unnamed protein product [Danaus chrysippus]|uniref:Conserved oligomeric Golgi complex subunit 1 n=1 Tax=Danaus chrysippus TaxID=151541 RepID=A0A8J2QMI0_9NEOP|nr:unnamed protein product [Danaus chrysippus]